MSSELTDITDIFFEDDDLIASFDDGVFTGRFKAANVTMPVAKKMSDWRMKQSKGKLHRAISDIRFLTKMEPDVRAFLASPEACENLMAGAIIVRSTFQKIAGNFFIAINRPQVPARLFTTEEEALAWLEKYK